MVLCSTTELTRTFSVMTGEKTIILCPMTQENNATFCNDRIQNREALSDCRKKNRHFFLMTFSGMNWKPVTQKWSQDVIGP